MSEITDLELLEAQHKLFVRHVAETELVWGLHCPEGWANADSCDTPDTLVYPFWSDAKEAQTCAVQEWSIFQPKSLPLVEFLENWCVGMYKEFILVGINWDVNLSGKELESLDLALQILQELKRRGKQLVFTLYKSQAEFEKMLLEVLQDERH